jgi:hypothetical protein
MAHGAWRMAHGAWRNRCAHAQLGMKSERNPLGFHAENAGRAEPVAASVV